MDLRERENIGDSFDRRLQAILNWIAIGKIFSMNRKM